MKYICDILVRSLSAGSSMQIEYNVHPVVLAPAQEIVYHTEPFQPRIVKKLIIVVPRPEGILVYIVTKIDIIYHIVPDSSLCGTEKQFVMHGKTYTVKAQGCNVIYIGFGYEIIPPLPVKVLYLPGGLTFVVIYLFHLPLWPGRTTLAILRV